jgi:hypothetical protein
MTRFAQLALLGALAACGSGSGDDTAPTETNNNPCGNSLVSAFPMDGAADASWTTTIDFLLANDDASAALTVTDGAGAAVAGTQSTLGTRVVFTPDAPLVHGEAYTAELAWACGTDTTSFTVGMDGSETVDAASLEGRTFGFGITTGRIVDPPELASVLSLMVQFDILLTVTGSSADSLDFLGGVTDETTGEQSLCSPSITFAEAADYSGNPHFSVASDSMEIVVAGDPIPVTDLTMSGTFTSGGAGISNATLAGIIDLGQELCDLVGASGVTCQPCPTGSNETCLDLVVDSMPGDERSTSVFEWTSADYPDDCVAE